MENSLFKSVFIFTIFSLSYAAKATDVEVYWVQLQPARIPVGATAGESKIIHMVPEELREIVKFKSIERIPGRPSRPHLTFNDDTKVDLIDRYNTLLFKPIKDPWFNPWSVKHGSRLLEHLTLQEYTQKGKVSKGDLTDFLIQYLKDKVHSSFGSFRATSQALEAVGRLPAEIKKIILQGAILGKDMRAIQELTNLKAKMKSVQRSIQYVRAFEKIHTILIVLGPQVENGDMPLDVIVLKLSDDAWNYLKGENANVQQ